MGGRDSPADTACVIARYDHDRDLPDKALITRDTGINSSRESLNRKGVSFSEETAGMASTSRKRTAHRTESSDRDALSSADESAPIMRHAQNNPPKGYNSISPTVAAKGSAEGAESTLTRADGAAGNGQRSSTQERSASVEQEAAAMERSEGGQWRAFLEKYGSVELENKGSVARDHLALERTFLAWLRTSLSFASIGIAVTQLFRLNTSLAPKSYSLTPIGSAESLSHTHARLRHIGKPLGATFIGISIVILFIGFHRYFEAQHYVIRGKFPASRGSIVVVTLVAGALIVASLVVILVIGAETFEK